MKIIITKDYEELSLKAYEVMKGVEEQSLRRVGACHGDDAARIVPAHD